jgi:hypothetical protein
MSLKSDHNLAISHTELSALQSRAYELAIRIHQDGKRHGRNAETFALLHAAFTAIAKCNDIAWECEHALDNIDNEPELGNSAVINRQQNRTIK